MELIEMQEGSLTVEMRWEEAQIIVAALRDADPWCDKLVAMKADPSHVDTLAAAFEAAALAGRLHAGVNNYEEMTLAYFREHHGADTPERGPVASPIPVRVGRPGAVDSA